MVKRKANGRALFYTRDSGGRHETTPAEYVRWASSRAEELGLAFHGTAEEIEVMIRDGCPASGDLFLDYGVAGNILSRPGFNALIQKAMADTTVTHVLIPRRDRLARPDDPVDGMKLENIFRENGITLIFMDQVCPPIVRGRKRDIGEMILALVEYDNSGKYRRELAQKILYAQMSLAKMGFSIGGRAPYGFRRWLAKDDATPVRPLADGEWVRMAHHHVVWLPGPEEEVEIIRRILNMLETMPASRVAATLTAEGVRAPDFGRRRTDHGINHLTSGVWHQTTIVSIARNPLVRALVSYGRRSMGDQLRFSPDGPRGLEDCDLRADGKPKVVRNADSSLITAPAKFEPIMNPARQANLFDTLDARAGTQRGKPRSQDPAKNPLGCRVFDMNCGWTMYRVPYAQSFRYLCGLYQQSHGQACRHNHVDGLTATRFILSCIRQRLLSSTLLPKLEKRLLEIAEREMGHRKRPGTFEAKEAALAEVKMKLERAAGNMSLAENQGQYKAMAAIFEDLRRQKDTLEAELTEAQKAEINRSDPKAEVAAAMNLARRLTELLSDPENLGSVSEVFRKINVRLFLRFREVQAKKRTLNKLSSGVVTFGSAAPPITIYVGPTGRRELKGPATSLDAEPKDVTLPPLPKPCGPGRESNSLGNVNRGDSRCTFVNEIIGISLVRQMFPQLLDFQGDAVLQLVEPGLYRKGWRKTDGT